MKIDYKDSYKRGLLDKILSYKTSLLLTVLSFILLTVFYLLIAQKVYTTEAIVEVSTKSNKLSKVVTVQSGDNTFFRHLNTQIDFLQSRSLMEKVVDRLYANIHYFDKNSIGYKRIDQNLPYEITYFKIKDPAFYGEKFYIKAISDTQYSLYLVKDSVLSHKFTKPLTFSFGKLLKMKYFDIAVEKSDNFSKKGVYFCMYNLQKYIDRVLKNLTVIQNSDKSSMIKITYSDTTPYSAKRIVDALIESFLDINTQNELSDAENLLDLIDQKLKTEKKKLDESENSLKSYLEHNKISGVDSQTNRVVNMMYQYEMEYEKSKLILKKLQTIQKVYGNSYDYKSITPLVSTLDNQSLTNFLQSIIADDQKYRDLRTRFKPQYPDLVKLRSAIRKKQHELKIMLNELEHNIKLKISTYKKYMQKYKSQLGDIPQKEFGYSRLKRQYDLIEKQYLFLLEKKTQIIISSQVQGDYKYRVIDYAYLPIKPSKPKPKLLILISLILGLILGSLYALMRDYFSKYIKSPADVVELTDIPYLGTIPYIKDKNLYNKLFVIKDSKSLASRKMWTIRTLLENKLPKKDSKGSVIAITSTMKGEGKTTIAANLALCLGLGDKKSVAVSMDLRLPELYLKFGVPNKYGISNVLFGNKTLPDVTYNAENSKNFYIIPAGELDKNPNLLINSAKIDLILEELRSHYDYIVLDLPPVSVAPEALLLMKKSDLVISTLKAGFSEKLFVNYLENIIYKNKIKNIAFILNGVDEKYIKEVSRKENEKYIKSHQKIVKNQYKKDSLFNRIFKKIFN